MKLHIKEIKWGIIGVGNVCEVKSGPAFQKCDGSELVAVMRRDGAAAEDFAKRHGVPKWYDDVDQLINDDEVNALYIATPPGNHLEIALKCAESGKATYIEKPMARNSTETKEIVEAFKKNHTYLFVAYYRRGQTYFHHAKTLLESGKLGELMTVTYNHLKPKWVQKEGQDTPWRLLPKHSGGGLVMDVGVHSVDIIDFLIGPMRDIRGTATKRDDSSFVVEDDVFFTGKFGEKGEVSMKWDFNGTSGTHKDDIVITGSRGKMYLSCFNYTPICVEYTTVRDLESIRERVQSKEEHVFERPEHAHQGLVQLICNELRGGEASPSTGESAIRVADIMDDVLNEFYDGKRREAFWE